MEIAVKRLGHGGIMANYKCTAACRHCLYACSPTRENGYIQADTAAAVCALLRQGGCRSVHIGGGEPFLEFEGLLALIRIVRGAGIAIEYIETNAYWATDAKEIAERLRRLRDAGGNALCISVDPFHAEYVPAERPLRLAEVCEQADFGYFLWQGRFLPDVLKLDAGARHTREEWENALGKGYIAKTANSYGLRFNGRALGIEQEYGSRSPAGELADDAPCTCLLSTDHYHIDLHGNFIPPGCTGFIIPMEELMKGIPAGKYTVFVALLESGTAGLLRYAERRGFAPDGAGYTSKCALCFHMRRWLSQNIDCPELDAEYYTEAMNTK